MKTNKEQEKYAFAEDSITFECKTDLQPKIVHSGPTTGYTFNPDFSWEMDLNPLLDATKDDKNYVPVDSETANPYDEACDALYKEGVIRWKADLTDIYNDVFRCIVSKLDQEVNKGTAQIAANGGENSLFHYADYYKGRLLEAKNIRDYVEKLFNDATFRYHELYKLELLGDK